MPKRRRLLLLLALLLATTAWLVWLAVRPGSPSGLVVGSKSCRDCHEPFYRLWSTSFHGLGMQPATAGFIRKNLPGGASELSIGSLQYQVEISQNRAWLVERGTDGEKRYLIEHALGGKNIFYFLTTLDRGRLQVLPLALSVRTKEWIDTTSSMVRHFPSGEGRTDAPLPWTDRLLTFNASCYGCHVSQVSTNYDPGSDTYHTTWIEPGINCETCHGPGGEHQRAAQEPRPHSRFTDLKIISVKQFTVEQKNDSCGSCHAKASPITTGFRPGERFFDHFDLVTLENPDFYPDGRDLGENYTMTSWRMSACVKSGRLDCLHCHTASGRYRFRDGTAANQACLPCHADKVENPASHTHHRADGQAVKCIGCHMPTTEFAFMRRTDHSMRPPSPAATVAFKSPNACNLCHADKTPAWADRIVRRWHERDYQARLLEPSQLVEAGRKRDWSRLPAILRYINSPERDEVFATSLIRLLATCPDDRKWPALRSAVDDPSPLVRSAAAGELQGNVENSEGRDALIRATGDKCRLVRIRAAGVLAAWPSELIPGNSQLGFKAAFRELEQGLESRPDDWSSQLNLGNLYLGCDRLDEARRAFGRAAGLRPEVAMPWVNLSIACARLGDDAAAEQALHRALKIEPDSAVANFNLALLEAEKGETADAERLLRAALRTDPAMAEAAYNLGVLLGEKGEYRQAVAWCRKAVALRPENARYIEALAVYERKKQSARQ